MQGAPLETSRIDKILVLQLCPIGDTLFGTPALRALRRRFPHARVADVTWAANREVLEGNPAIDRLVLCRSALQLPRVLSALADEDFDAVVGLSNIGSWLTLFTRAEVRVGFNSQTLGWLYTQDVPDRRELHAVDYCLEVVAALGAESDGRHLDLPVSERERQWARRFLRADRGRPALRVAMHPGGRYFPAKRWPTSGYAYVADYLAGQHGAQIVVVGGPDDVALAEEMADECRLAEPLVAAGRAGIKQTAALIEQCDLFIGNDSAPMHMAEAVGTPVVAMFGPTNPGNFRPLGPFDVVVRKELPCSPCFHWLGGSRQYLMHASLSEQPAPCMRSITPRDVIVAVEGQIDRLGLRAHRGLVRPPAPPPVDAELAWALPGYDGGAIRLLPLRPGRMLRRAAIRRRYRHLAVAGRRGAPHKVQEFEEI